MIDEEFVSIPRKLLDEVMSIGANATVLLVGLFALADDNGNVAMSRAKLSKKTGLTEREIRTNTEYLKRLKIINQATKKTTKSAPLITICNFESYKFFKQSSDQENDQTATKKTTKKNRGLSDYKSASCEHFFDASDQENDQINNNFDASDQENDQENDQINTAAIICNSNNYGNSNSVSDQENDQENDQIKEKKETKKETKDRENEKSNKKDKEIEKKEINKEKKENFQYIERDTRENENLVVEATAKRNSAIQENDQIYNYFFAPNMQGSLEAFCMQNYLSSIADLKNTAQEIITEWNLAGVTHHDATGNIDFKSAITHLQWCIRSRLSEKRRRPKTREETRGDLINYMRAKIHDTIENPYSPTTQQQEDLPF